MTHSPLVGRNWLLLCAIVTGTTSLVGAPARAFDLGGLAGKAGHAARDKVIKDVNAKLLAEGRKDQCSFKSDSDQLTAGCDKKIKKLANTLIDAKKKLQAGGVSGFKFEVSGHTDSAGKPEHNKELSAKRAAVIVRELTARGVAPGEIISIGMGSDRPLVTPDDTPAKKAKNRRYEIQVRI
ncbi:MAG TPA: OmpA family protein [Polyangia bacterium]|jgi:outer membrane protein OmpA-like peptidoglycan-associated protein|nr:OmpA family protein [Polyangia bacterium]